MDNRQKFKFIQALLSSKKMLMILTAGSGISFPEYGMLMLIYKLSHDAAEPRGVPVTRIKEQTHITLPAVSQHMRSLEQRGLVERKTEEKDRRITLVTLTPAGQEFLKKVWEHSDLAIDDLAREIGEDSILQYIDLTARIMQQLEKSRKTERNRDQSTEP